MNKHNYARFFLMILVSTVVMFFIMYFEVFEIDHIYFNIGRVYMALMMGAAMAVIMLLFMWKMYGNKTINIGILLSSALLFALSLFMVRAQVGVGELSWMKGMIPHHSMAILTSSRAELSDPRVRALAQDIIQTQEREIAEMKALIAELESN